MKNNSIAKDRQTMLSAYIGQTLTGVIYRVDEDGDGYYRLAFKRPEDTESGEITIYVATPKGPLVG